MPSGVCRLAASRLLGTVTNLETYIFNKASGIFKAQWDLRFTDRQGSYRKKALPGVFYTAMTMSLYWQVVFSRNKLLRNQCFWILYLDIQISQQRVWMSQNKTKPKAWDQRINRSKFTANFSSNWANSKTAMESRVKGYACNNPNDVTMI